MTWLEFKNTVDAALLAQGCNEDSAEITYIDVSVPIGKITIDIDEGDSLRIEG